MYDRRIRALLPLVFILGVGFASVSDAALVGWWRFNDGSGAVAKDSSGKGYDGTVINPDWVQGQYGGALNFTGTNYVDVPAASWSTIRTQATVCFWAYGNPTAQPQANFIFGAFSDPANNDARKMSAHVPWSDGTVYFDTGGPSFDRISKAGDPAQYEGTWTFWTFLKNADTGAQQIYINGQLWHSGTGMTKTMEGVTKFTIGTKPSLAEGWYQGMIDDFRLYDEALSVEQIQQAMTGRGPGTELASDPVPADGTTDVPRGPALSWKPGEFAQTHDVYFGTVFEDVNTASRANPKGLLVSQDQMDPAYDPQGPLAYGRTYYWRIDEVNAAPDNTVFKGLTWSFTVEPFSYPVTPVAAAASSSATGMGPENTINGSGLSDNDEHSTVATQMWTSGSQGPHWIQYEFDKAIKLDKLLVWNSNQVIEPLVGFGAKDVTIEFSADGTTWTALQGVPEFAQASGEPDYKASTVVDFGGVTAKFVKLTITSNWGGVAPQTSLSEVRFFYVPVRAFQPAPADGAANVSIETALTWRPGREAASHEVRLGTGPDAMALAGTVNVPNFTPAPLTLGTTYYWQVNEVNQAETVTTWAGDVWSFTTQAYRLVDDFEGYTNDIDAGGTIFQTWIDGFEVAANGATVGYIEAPFAETVIVRGAKQAMLLSYDNRTASYSEAKASTADLPIGSNWSLGSPETLVLWVRGDLANGAADQLYVKINNTKVTYPGSLSVPIWRQWNVALAGIQIGNVATLSIGVDGKGAGRLYVDDIALYRQAPAILGPGPGGDPSLVGHWKLDETAGLIAADSSGYGNHGTLVGMAGTEWKTGTRGGALEFAGTGKYVNCGNDTSLRLRGSVTLSVWVKMNANNAGLYMGIGGKLKTDPYKGFSLVRHSSNVFRFWADNGANVIAGYEADSDKPYTDSEWHHVVGVVDAGTSMLYIDRVKQTKQGTVSLTDSGEIVHIGRQYSGLDDRYWNGLIDDVRIYYRALSAQEIAGL